MKIKILISVVVVLAVGFHSKVNSQEPLPIPYLDAGMMQNGNRKFNLLMQNSTKEFLPGVQTPTSGYNGTLLGPTLSSKGISQQFRLVNLEW